MKNSIIALAGILLLMEAAAATGPTVVRKGEYSVVAKDEHSRTWQQVTVEWRDGLEHSITNSYVEVATGLHRWDPVAGDFVEASAAVELTGTGDAISRRTGRQIIFSANANALEGTTDLLTPSGARYRGQVLGLVYVDDLGNSALTSAIAR